MGRIKNAPVKTLAERLIEEHGDKFTEEFDKNKKAMEKIESVKSKRVRNILVGYITRRMRQIKKTGL